MIAFSVSCFVFSLIVLFLSPELYQIHKGQLIVLDENPNSTSSRLVIAVTYVLYFIMRNPFNLGQLRFFGLLLLPSLVSMIVLSGSRGSLLSMLLGAYVIFLLTDIGKIKKIVLTLIFFGFSLYLFKKILVSEELGSRWEAALDGDTAGRTDVWSAVIDISYNNPLGVGETGYIEKINNLFGYHIDTHNLFLYVLVCGGYISLFLFSILWIRVLIKSLRVYLYSKDILPMVMFVSILFLVSKTGGVITFLLFWFVFALINGYQKSRDSLHVV
ncbi:O-antigen ligase family protein [Psychrobacter celer]|uniref:O-antigen ligase family protein n=1 Tax=Psychrobacter celer TaxID=306572 RepID=UPI003FD52E4C